MPNYHESIIYKICCKDPSITDIYVGSTTNFKSRKYQHKLSCNNENSGEYLYYKYLFIRENGGWENWDMIQIKAFKCENKRELEAEERKIIEETGATLNKNIPFRLKKEYNEDNKEKIKIYKREYYQKNKVEITKKFKESYKKKKLEKGIVKIKHKSV